MPRPRVAVTGGRGVLCDVPDALGAFRAACTSIGDDGGTEEGRRLGTETLRFSAGVSIGVESGVANALCCCCCCCCDDDDGCRDDDGDVCRGSLRSLFDTSIGRGALRRTCPMVGAGSAVRCVVAVVIEAAAAAESAPLDNACVATRRRGASVPSVTDALPLRVLPAVSPFAFPATPAGVLVL